MTEVVMSRLEAAIKSLIINTNAEVRSRIEQVSFDVEIRDTKSKAHCYSLKADANGELRLKDLIDFIDIKIVEYAIPKKDIDAARDYFNKTGSPAKIIELRKRANNLFTDLERTGEGGEILLYILIQEFLRIPQLISKMSLKTSGNIHYHGADGIHVNYDDVNDLLKLYWAEAKMYSDLNSALTACFRSLKGFLLDSYSYKSTQERDLQLITDQITNNVNNEEFENILVRYFDKDDDLSNRVSYSGICFIGFDSDVYNIEVLKRSTEEIKKQITLQIDNWLNLVGTKIKEHDKLDLKEIHVFMIPFLSVADFRKYYLETVK